MSSKIFEEAVADAKKLREVAEDNAKKAILEAVTPRIREFIEDQLLETDEEGDIASEDIEDIDEDVVLDESSLKSLVTMLGGEGILHSLNESNTYNAFNSSVKAAISSLKPRQRKKLLEIADKINNSADILQNKRINNKVVKNEEKSDMTNRNFYEVDLQALREQLEDEMGEQDLPDLEGLREYDDEEDEFDESLEEESGMDIEDEEMDFDEGDEMDFDEGDDMDDMLNELRLAIELGDEIEEDMLPPDLQGMLLDDEEDEDVEMEEEGEEEDEEGAEEEGDDMDFDMDIPMPPMEGGEEGEEGDEDVKEESFYVDGRMLREELSRVRRMLREGNMEHSWGGKGSSKAGVKNSFGGSGKKNAGYKGAFGGGAYGQDVFTNPPQMNKLNENLRKQRRLNRALTEKLNKYRSAVQTLREQLEDLNLFNAKLLYVNKLLQNKSLNESEKKSIIKALDESRSLNEAKSLYNSLTETLSKGTRGKTLNESRRYASSSRTTTSSSSRGRASGELDRWQTLAGLK